MSDRGTRIRNRRKALGKTQKEVADYVGVSRNSISQWENNQVGDITGTHLAKLSRYLETTAEYILDGGDPSPSHYEANKEGPEAVSLNEQQKVAMRFIMRMNKDELAEVIRDFQEREQKDLAELDRLRQKYDAI